MESQLAKIVNEQISYERISAIDGSKLTKTEKKAFSGFDSKGEKNKIQLSLREIACFLSHQKVWKTITSSSEEYGVVFEDDILISSKASRFLSNPEWIPDKTKFIRLETTIGPECHLKNIYEGKLSEGIHFKLCQFKGGGCGTGAYIIQRDFARFLGDHFCKFSSEVDRALLDSDLFTKQTKFSFDHNMKLQLVPAIAVQQQFYSKNFLPTGAEISSIGQRKKPLPKLKMTKIKKIRREFRRLFYKQSYYNLYNKLFVKSIPFLE